MSSAEEEEIPVQEVVPARSGVLSEVGFAELSISTTTKSALAGLGFNKMTHIQSRSIPQILAGKDIVGAAKTGSGKT